MLSKVKSANKSTKKKTTEIFIKEAKLLFNNKYDYSKSTYINNKKKLIITCLIHGDFAQSPGDHLNGHGCRLCGNVSKKKLKLTDFLDRAHKKHGHLYDYSLIKEFDSSVKVKIICNVHGVFIQSGMSHISGIGCPECGWNKTANKLKSNTNEFIQKAIKIHGNKYDYSLVDYKRKDLLITIKCSIHGEFEQTPNRHLNSYGCQICGKLEGYKKRTKTLGQFLENAYKIHGTTYDYRLVEYNGCINNIDVICLKHGAFTTFPNRHLSGYGCSACGKEKVGQALRTTVDEFIKKANYVHNNLYDYSKVIYHDTGTKVIIGCAKHGDFNQAPHSHLNGQGCPKCNNIISRPEKAWLDSFNNPNMIRQHLLYQNPDNKRNKITVDGYDPITNTVYEFHGDYWHGNPGVFDSTKINKDVGKTFGELYKKTIDREDAIRKLGYNLNIMWESDWNNLALN